MDRLFGVEAGQTPLDPDDIAGLRLGFIATRGELDAAEQSNVAKAITWSRVRRPTPERILDEPFVRGLHRRMFGDVWSWAGRYRTTSRNLGIDPWLISEGIGALLGDARHWLEIGDDHDAVCVRVHHRLVQVHPLPMAMAAMLACMQTFWLSVSAHSHLPGGRYRTWTPRQSARRTSRDCMRLMMATSLH